MTQQGPDEQRHIEESASEYETERTEENEPHNHQKQGPYKQGHMEEYEPKYITAVTGGNKTRNHQEQAPTKQRHMEVSASENNNNNRFTQVNNSLTVNVLGAL